MSSVPFRTPSLCLALMVFVLAGNLDAKPLQSTDLAINQLPRVIKEIEDLTKQYLDPAIRVKENRFIVKLNEGRLHYFKEDYRTAAMTLLELVETYNQKKSSPIYKDALFYLADSLYHIGNFRTAARFFEQVLTLNEPKMRPCALGRLLEVSLRLKLPEKGLIHFGEALEHAQRTSDNSLMYLLGKFSYELNKFDDAIRLWDKVSKESSMYPQARYFMGVAHTQKNELKKALTLFEEVKLLDLEVLRIGLNFDSNQELAPEVDVTTGYVIEAGQKKATQQDNTTGCTFRSELEKEEEVKGWELVQAHAELAVGRVLYEIGETKKSYSKYLEIDRSSPLFMDAIKESVWVSIKKGEYNSALQQMDVQLIDEPNMLNDPFTRLLQGRLLSILGRFADAQSIFGELKSRFENFKARSLSPILAKARGQLASYFQKQLEEGVSALNLESLLPKAALKFTKDELSSAASRSLFVELNALDQDIVFSKQTIKDLFWVLDAPNQSEIFPQLHRGLLKALELRYRLFEAQAKLNDKQAASLVNNSEYQKLLETRTKIQKVLSQVPQTEVQLNEREAKIEHQLMLLDLKLYKLKRGLKNLRAQLIALKTYLQNAKPDEIVGVLSPRDRASALKSVNKELAVYDQHIQKINAITDSIKKIYLRVGLFDEVFIHEEEIRGQYSSALDQETEWLLTQGKIPISRLSDFERAHNIIDDFQERSLRLVSENSSSLREKVKVEEAKIKKYESRLRRLNRQAKRLAGQMVAQIFYQILQQLDRFILEADAGILDMLWAQKNLSTNLVQGERDQRRIHFEILNRDMVE